MKLFEMSRRRKKPKQEQYSVEESLEILSSLFDRPSEKFLNFKNHIKHDLKPNTFRFTLDIMSLEVLISIMELSQVKNVYFNPSVPPPGGSIDSISMRYKVYVEYHSKN